MTETVRYGCFDLSSGASRLPTRKIRRLSLFLPSTHQNLQLVTTPQNAKGRPQEEMAVWEQH